MRKFHFVFSLAILLCIGLSFSSKSNFHQQESAITDAEIKAAWLAVDSVPDKKIEELVQNKLVKPIYKILEEKDPHIFMTKLNRLPVDTQVLIMKLANIFREI